MPKGRYLRDDISQQLARDIVSGRIFPGERLTEASLSGRFGVSRTPLREALMLLERQGFVEYNKNAGATVRKIDEDKLLEIIDICAVLEGRALEVALSGGDISEEDVSYLESLEEAMERFVSEGDYPGYMVQNIEFHDFLLKKCQNEELRHLHDEFNERILVYRKSGIHPRSANLRKFINAHRSIIETIRRGDSFQARLLLERHVREGRQTLTRQDMEKLVP